MRKKNTSRCLGPLAALLLATLAPLTGCGETEGPAQKAGEKIDAGIQKAKDAITQPGPAEKAGRALDKATGQ
jgi:hypothetical protein